MTEHMDVTFANGWPKVLRYSSILARLRATNTNSQDVVSTIDKLTVMYNMGNHCSVHGHLEDPILFTVDYDDGSKIVIACPHCSDPRLLEQWEKEPPGWLGEST